jgi:hypothetical protein
MRRVNPIVAVLDTLDRALLQPFLRSCPCRHLMTLTALGYVAAVGVIAFAAMSLLAYWLAFPITVASAAGLYCLFARMLRVQLHFHVRRVHVMGQTCTWRLSRG